MLGKRYTRRNHTCPVCGGLYARKFVLKRHMLTQHDISTNGSGEQFTYGQRKDDSTFLLGMQYLDQKKAERRSRMFGEEMIRQRSETPVLSSAAQGTDIDNIVTPLLKMTSRAIQASSDFYIGFLQDNFFIPKNIVSGFSGYVCRECLGIEIPIPIKDLGYDLTCATKHRCAEQPFEFENKQAAVEIGSQSIARILLSQIDRWTAGKNLLIAKRITKSEVMRLIDNTKIPNRLYLTYPIDVGTSPWLRRLFMGQSLEPNSQELFEFCKICLGTYAIIHVSDPASTDLYFYTLLSRKSSSAVQLDLQY